ncbi:hypothetical protein Acsp03_37250 [Actinomadura sp. NBRC 104412]|uniref:tetratricopeptide repeat protein n=1 Tax=Actinomadura sp. NBRC 104412 TaxID=3032203 RepID=UPI0024A104D3|nr:tetratricopeptide repeat protein [Actinomadura sp. NBRC 104412]GLZ06259.1 hypothetical protein Acsp03_37250 [Actinomadura sp. NBRC 104412]
MGLRDPERWRTELGEEVTRHLAEWADGQRILLGHRGWFTDGRSGSPVARAVRVRENGDTDQVVLKFFSRDGRTKADAIRRGWEDAGDFQKRLAAAEEQIVRLGTWSMVFLHIAGGDLGDIRPLGDDFDHVKFPKRCAAIVCSIISRWNEGRLRTDQQALVMVGELLNGIMRHRKEAAERWARDHIDSRIPLDGALPSVRRAGWPAPLANPFRLVHGAEGGREVEDLIIGKAHGDLSGRNILVVNGSKRPADEYFLIDYDRYSDKAPLARDPMHLLVALTLDRFHQFHPDFRRALAEVVVAPDTRDTPQAVRHIKKLSEALRTETRGLARAKGMGSQWEEQRLLSLVGAGLVHLGRDLRTEDEDAAKEWCFHVAALAATHYLGERPESDLGEPVGARPRVAVQEIPGLVDRHGDVRNLVARLTRGPWGVVVVRGTRGIGKTRLVDAALGALPADASGGAAPRVHRHDVRTADRLDVSTLIRYVRDDDASRTARRPRPVAGGPRGSSLVRLELALRENGGTPVVVAVDSAEKLLDPATGTLADPDLDDALELIAGERGHRVAVLLVSRHEPASPANATWPTAADPIHVGELPGREFFRYLASLDRARRTDPEMLSESGRAVLYGRLRGNPRLAELVHAVVVVVESGLDLPALTERLRGRDADDVPAFLTGLIVEHATELQRSVLEALAAFDTPVPEEAVVGLLEEISPGRHRPGKVRQALSTLAADQVVHRLEGDQYAIPSEDGRLILGRMASEETRADRYLFAAHVLRRFRNDDPRGVADLRVHFAELRALLCAGEPGAAHNQIELLHELLARWNSRQLLLPQREEIRGRLAHEHQEMANESALGWIYASLGAFGKANAAYGRAMKLADDLKDPGSKLKLHGNLAGMCWERDDVLGALSHYEFARDEATRLNLMDDRMTALEGIADCHRRNGDYDEAVRCAEEARYLAGTPGVRIALKLARWSAERGRAHQAETLLESARRGLESDDRLRASYLDVRADLLFDRDDLEAAERAALEAESEALRAQDPVTLMQARTTLAFIYLKWGERRGVHQAINGAWRYRRNRRSLVVLALRALVARQRRDPEAERLFQRLGDEASARIDHNERDFTAWHYRSFAVCGRHLHSEYALDEAVDEALTALGKAREIAPPVPALEKRLKVLFTRLDQCGSRPGGLSGVIDDLPG